MRFGRSQDPVEEIDGNTITITITFMLLLLPLLSLFLVCHNYQLVIVPIRLLAV